MTDRLGIAAVVPDALLDAARELLALNDMDPAQRQNIRVPVSATGADPATHYVGNWQIAAASFFGKMAANSVADPEDWPDWIDADLVNAALADWQVYDPLSKLQTIPTLFDAADVDTSKIVLVILENGKRAETAARLAELGLQFVEADIA
jgi:hypothetical protein